MLEKVPAKLATEVSESLHPTIGIGAGVGCDGQVSSCPTCWASPRTSRYASCRYLDMGQQMHDAIGQYVSDVRSNFPTKASNTDGRARNLCPQAQGAHHHEHPENLESFEDNHIIAVNKRSSDIVQGDITNDRTLDNVIREYLRVKYDKPGEAWLGTIHRSTDR